MDIRLKRAIAVCLLAVGSNADAAMATDNAAPQGLIIREPWTADAFVKGFTREIVGLPFIRAWAYAEAIDRYCFHEKSYANDVGVGLEETAKSRGEYLACAPAMKFVERTVTQIPKLANKFQQLMSQLAHAKELKAAGH